MLSSSSSFICFLSSFHSLRCNFSSSLGPRHFPDYTPKKPTIRDSQLVYNIYTTIKSPSLEARCIIIQISVAAKDPKMAHGLIHDFWTKPNVDATLPFTLFMEKLIYTYKDWGSNPHVFDIFFQVLVQVGILDGAKKLFYKMLNYGVVISVDSCNLYLSQLSKNTDRCKATSRIFSEFFKEGVKWNTMSHNIMIHSLC
ncbi:pentatricopeptide repeat-containing protein [Tanacetum coccineum]